MYGGLTLVRDLAPGVLTHGLGRLVALAVLVAAGGAIYVLMASALRAPELAQIRGMLRRRPRSAA